MNIRVLLTFLSLTFLAAICTAHAVEHAKSTTTSTNAAGNEANETATTTTMSMLRRGLQAATSTWPPVWWERIKNSYQGNDLKLCTMRSAPAKGSWCGKNKSTCFFGNMTCPTVGANPTAKCFCNGTSTKRGTWSCSPEKCPPVPTPTPAGIFRSSPGRAFDVRLNLATPQILKGYDKIADLVVDLDQAIRFDINYKIETSTSRYPIGVRHLPEGAPSSAFQDVPSPRSASIGVTDFGTSDKSDLVKNNGIYVFAVYGPDIIVSNAATGKYVANYTLPTVDRNGMIKGVSLVADRLVLYVEKGSSTRVIVLDISKLPCCITLVTRNEIRGRFRDARLIDNNIHLITSSTLGMEQFSSLERYNYVFEGMNNAAYKKAAAKRAEPLIANVVAQLKNGISANGKPPKMPKIALWQTDVGDNGNQIEYIHGPIGSSYMQITSFSVQQGFRGNLTLSKAGAFLPSFDPIWAIDGSLLFATQGYNWNPLLQGSSERTYLLGFKLNGASATPSFLGSVDGRTDLRFKYSWSVYQGHLNVAATNQWLYPVWKPVVDGNGYINEFPPTTSIRNNTVRVLKIPTGNETVMTEATAISGFVQENAYFTFFKNICYVGTFLHHYATRNETGNLVMLSSKECHLTSPLLLIYLGSARHCVDSCTGFEPHWCQGVE
jgi:hypothetical protein